MKRLMKLDGEHFKYPIDRFPSIACTHGLGTKIQQNILLIFAIRRRDSECRLAAREGRLTK
jgi:hypothetical protein